MKLSIIIPAFNESGKLSGISNLPAEFLRKNSFEGEIIVADDGSEDKTADKSQIAGGKYGAPKQIKVIRNQQHRGKGYAVTQPV